MSFGTGRVVDSVRGPASTWQWQWQYPQPSSASPQLSSGNWGCVSTDRELTRIRFSTRTVTFCLFTDMLIG